MSHSFRDSHAKITFHYGSQQILAAPSSNSYLYGPIYNWFVAGLVLDARTEQFGLSLLAYAFI